MGKSVTPRYFLEIDDFRLTGQRCIKQTHRLLWSGRASRLEDYVFTYAKSLGLKGANKHISLSLSVLH
jgi:hypothetical protein